MTGIARAKHYPQPPPADQVLRGARCEHGELVGRCAPCRSQGVEPPDDQDVTTPTAPPRPPRRRAARHRKDELADVAAVQGELDLFTRGGRPS